MSSAKSDRGWFYKDILTKVFSWIWGKPGCGKSTLMKAMLNNRRMKIRLQELLSHWGGNRVLFGTFFFFRPGLDLQKSQVGFLQSILHQILSLRPHFIDLIYTPLEKSQAIDRLKHFRLAESSPWSLNELRRAFERWRALDNSYLYLHLDGIDEIECEALELAHLLLGFANSPKVKVLAAGRYHPDFNACFDLRQKLKIHELTEPDILRFTIDTVKEGGLEDVLDLMQRPHQLARFIIEIVSAAQGVFQWVNIVINSLLRGLHRFETFEQLFTRLKEYPKDLDDLYFFLYRQIETRYAANVAFWMLAVFCEDRGNEIRYGPKILDTYYMSQAEIYDLRDKYWLAQRLEETRQTVQLQACRTQQRMQAQCPHFFEFEVTPNSVKRISFAHRTILDFLSKNNFAMINELYRRLESGHVPKLSVTAVETLHGLKMLLAPDTNQPSTQTLWGTWQYEALPTSYRLLKQGLTLEMFSFWEQIKYAFIRSSAISWCPKWRSTVPTMKDWTTEYPLETIERVNVLRGRLLHVLALHFPRRPPPDGACMVVEMARSLGCDYHERELLLLELFWSQSIYPYWTEQHKKPVNGTDRHKQTINYPDLFPNGITYDCVCLRRVLELIRHDVILFNPNSNLAIETHVTSLGSYVKFTYDLIKHGANPNTMCLSVDIDTDKSHISIMVLLDRMEDSITPFGDNSCVGSVKTYMQMLRSLLDEIGGLYIVIPSKIHQQADANISAAYRCRNVSKLLCSTR